MSNQTPIANSQSPKFIEFYVTINNKVLYDADEIAQATVDMDVRRVLETATMLPTEYLDRVMKHAQDFTGTNEGDKPIAIPMKFAENYRTIIRATNYAPRLSEMLENCAFSEDLTLLKAWLTTFDQPDDILHRIIHKLNDYALEMPTFEESTIIKWCRWALSLHHIFEGTLDVVTYLNPTVSYKANLNAFGINGKVILKQILKHSSILEKPEYTKLNEIDINTLTQFFGKELEAESIVVGLGEGKYDAATWINHLCSQRDESSKENQRIWYVISGMPYLYVWLSNFRNWCESFSRHWSEELQRYIPVHHHGVMHQLSVDDYPGSLKTHPKGVYQELINKAVQETIERYKEAAENPYEDFDCFKYLPKNFWFIDNAAMLQDEGTAMHHCCGSYDSECREGDSLFFHYQNDTTHGITIELTLDTKETYRQGMVFPEGTYAFVRDNEFYLYRVNECRHYRNDVGGRVTDKERAEIAEILTSIVSKQNDELGEKVHG